MAPFAILTFITEDAVWAWVFHNAPFFGILIFMTWWSWHLSWRLRGQIADFERRIEAMMDAKLARLEAKLEVRFQVIESRLQAIENRLQGIENRLQILEGAFQVLVTQFFTVVSILKEKKLLPQHLFNKNSPVKLTAFALTVLSDSGAMDYLYRNIEILIAELERKRLRSPLDVESSAIQLCHEHAIRDDDFTAVKNYIYMAPILQNPEDPTGEGLELNILNVSWIMGIHLRDLYLHRHPDILPHQ